MSVFAPEVVSFDLGPPLQHGGGETFMKRWRELFEAYQNPVDYEVRDLSITVGDDVAFSHSLNRVSGMTQNGQKSDRWLLDGVLPQDQWEVADCSRTGVGSH